MFCIQTIQTFQEHLGLLASRRRFGREAKSYPNQASTPARFASLFIVFWLSHRMVGRSQIWHHCISFGNNFRRFVVLRHTYRFCPKISCWGLVWFPRYPYPIHRAVIFPVSCISLSIASYCRLLFFYCRLSLLIRSNNNKVVAFLYLIYYISNLLFAIS